MRRTRKRDSPELCSCSVDFTKRMRPTQERSSSSRPRSPHWSRPSADGARRHGVRIRSCDRSLEIDPTLAKAWYDRGLAHSAADRPSDALTDFSHAVEIDAQFAEAYNARGLVLVAMERMDEAAQDFRAASQLDPLLAARAPIAQSRAMGEAKSGSR